MRVGPPLLLLLGDEGHWSPGTWKGRLGSHLWPNVMTLSLGAVGRFDGKQAPPQIASTSGPEATGDAGPGGIAEGRWCWGSACRRWARTSSQTCPP